MAQEVAEARGRTVIRPWRVGVLTDTSSHHAVREAIIDLSSVWGGCYMPILDINSPTASLERLGNEYDVDSIYADVVEGSLGEFLRSPGWTWSGRGPWGPFGEEHGFREGLLPIKSFIGDSTNFVQPLWDPDDPADLALAAIWGIGDRLGVELSSTIDHSGPRSYAYSDALPQAVASKAITGAIDATSLHVRPHPRAYLDDHAGVYVMRPDHPADVVEFWNMRTYGLNIIGVPARAPADLVRFFLSPPMPSIEKRQGSRESRNSRLLRVWGLEDAADEIAMAIRSTADQNRLDLLPHARGSWPPFVFQGLRTPFTRTIRADFRPEAPWIDVTLPPLPLRDEPDAYTRGIVAAEVQLHSVRGQDPRLTASIPPYRRHSSLIQHACTLAGIDQARVTHAGTAIGIDANVDHARIPFANAQDVMRLLFDDTAVTTTQSDAGRFQSRAAEKFGGPFSGAFNQPGLRAAVELAAGRDSGVTLPHLRNVVDRSRGAWPDPLFASKSDADKYAIGQVNRLFHSGIFVPTLKVHCSHCRVERYVSADDLASTMTCEFCGQDFNLGLSHALAPPEWRYRLAAHLRPPQVQALLPALAAASFLSQLRHIEEPPLPHVLGLEVSIDQRTVEVDVAAYLPDPDWAAILAEVKTANRIDDNDIANLEFLQGKLSDKGVRCLLLFATLKSSLSPQEVAGLRGLVQRSRSIRLSNGRLLPNLPMVLTGADLSHPSGSKDHPWRWDSKNYSGIFGTAITSCERNLGLRNYTLASADDDRPAEFDWSTDMTS